MSAILVFSRFQRRKILWFILIYYSCVFYEDTFGVLTVLQVYQYELALCKIRPLIPLILQRVLLRLDYGDERGIS